MSNCEIMLSERTTIEKLRSFRLETLIWQDVPEKRYRIVSNHFAAPKLSECQHRFVSLLDSNRRL